MLELVIGQLTDVRAVGPHDVNLAIGLTVVGMQRRLVPETPARTGERDPFAVGRPGAMRVVTRRMSQTLELGAIGLDRANLVVPFFVTGEGDEIADGRPGWEIVARRAGLQFFRFARLHVEDEQGAPFTV